jgi:Polyketide cyclase / dehydrase and lipid transport
VDEPEPGRVLRESDQNSSLITKFTVDPGSGQSSLVKISTSWQGAGGIGGFFERTFAPRAMKAIYEDELQRLATYAQEQQR